MMVREQQRAAEHQEGGAFHILKGSTMGGPAWVLSSQRGPRLRSWSCQGESGEGGTLAGTWQWAGRLWALSTCPGNAWSLPRVTSP